MSDPRKKDYKEKIALHRRIEPVLFETTQGNPDTTPVEERVTSTGLNEYNGVWSEKQVGHLLKRTLFGPKRAEIEQFMAMSPSDAVDAIISPSEFPGPPVNDYFSQIEDPDIPAGETWVEAPYGEDLEGYRIVSLKGWIIKNMVTQEPSIHQKLVLFWHNILPTQFWELGLSKLSYKYYKMLYDNAFGNYKTIIVELTRDPAMLFFLNGAFNIKDAPDENYARELQELFTIGKGPDAAFSESDVREAAKILTGWTIIWDSVVNAGPPQSIFVDYYHDTGDKQFSSFYGERVIEGRSGLTGSEEMEELVDMIFDNTETARYICRRIYNFFVYHTIDENTEQNVIIPLADIFRDSNYEILPVLRALFKSEHFYDQLNIGAYIKNPADHLLGIMRTMELSLPEDPTDGLYFYNSVYWSMANKGMEIGDPPSVAGWQAYYQQPSFDKLWINTDTITKRARTQDNLLNVYLHLPAFAATLSNPGDPNELIKESAMLLHGIDLNDDVVAGLKDSLLTGQQEDYYWTTAWLQYIDDPENEEYRVTVSTRLRSMFRSFMQLSEFHLT